MGQRVERELPGPGNNELRVAYGANQSDYSGERPIDVLLRQHSRRCLEVLSHSGSALSACV